MRTRRTRKIFLHPPQTDQPESFLVPDQKNEKRNNNPKNRTRKKKKDKLRQTLRRILFSVSTTNDTACCWSIRPVTCPYDILLPSSFPFARLGGRNSPWVWVTPVSLSPNGLTSHPFHSTVLQCNSNESLIHFNNILLRLGFG